ncbi:MAG: phosphate ABC transporter substrate-binding protein [Spirochaetales bacterium]|nr:phosphate ABC transporter substrate-binding protein [Spirochaetales bacterium]
MNKTFFFVIMTLAFIPLWAGAQGEEGAGLRLSMGGSTTVEPIITSAMEVYLAEVDPQAELSYDAPGSTAGIRGVLNGVYDLGTASRALLLNEKEQGAVLTNIALDGLAVIVHETVPIDDISLEDLASIYVGEIKNWKDLGGPDHEIVVVNRDEASGTLGAFEELVLERIYGDDGRFIREALITESNGNMATMVTQTPYSIGYGSLAIIDRVENSGGKALTIGGIEDTAENVLTGKYPIVRPLSFVSFGKPEGTVLTFIEFLLSPRGQEIILEAKYVPLQ